MTDWNVVLWDVVSGEAELCLRFLLPVAKVRFNLRDKVMFLVCPMRHASTFVTLGVEGPNNPDQRGIGDFDDWILRPSRETDNHRKLKGKGMTS